MKVGTENKQKTWTAVALFAVALLVTVYELLPSSSRTPFPVAQSTAPASAAGAKGERARPVFSKLDPSLRLDLLKGSEEVSYQGSGRDIFHAEAEPAKDVGKVDESPIISSPNPVAQKPSIPLKFYGFASANNKKQIFLSQGEDVFVAKEGDIVKGRYKVIHVNPRDVEIQDVLGNYSQSVPLTLPNS